jgi:hypothetical protein
MSEIRNTKSASSSVTQPPHSFGPVQEQGPATLPATSSAQLSGNFSKVVGPPALENTNSPATSMNQDLSGSISLAPLDLDHHFKHSFELNYPYNSFIETNPDPSICGLKYRWSFGRPGSKTEHISTIGGVLRVNDTLWGLTTAHAVFTANRGRAFKDLASRKKALPSQTFSNNSTSGQSDSESSTEGEEWEEDSRELGDVPVSRLVVDGPALGQTPPRDTQWKRVSTCGPRSFAGWSDALGDEIWISTPSISCDFALIYLNDLQASPMNSYHSQADGQPSAKVCVEGIMKDIKLTPGRVLVLTRPGTSEQAYLLPGNSLFSMFNHSFITRKLRLEKPLGKSLSSLIPSMVAASHSSLLGFNLF